MGLSLAQVGRAETLARTAIALRALLAGGATRFDTGIEGRLAWLDAPRVIPIYLAGSGPRMLETAGRLGDGAIVYATVSPDVVRVAIEHVAVGARAAGRDPAALDVALWAPMSIGRDRERARDHARGRVASACRHPLPVRLSDEDETAIRRVREAYDAYEHATPASRHRTLVTERLVDLWPWPGRRRRRGAGGSARRRAGPHARHRLSAGTGRRLRRAGGDFENVLRGGRESLACRVMGKTACDVSCHGSPWPSYWAVARTPGFAQTRRRPRRAPPSSGVAPRPPISSPMSGSTPRRAAGDRRIPGVRRGTPRDRTAVRDGTAGGPTLRRSSRRSSVSMIAACGRRATTSCASTARPESRVTRRRAAEA